ncbi:malto-oligosyltrehalose synthase [Porifericola rhodea]|uniref:malto-oligosyltrehalose synthase n=1 Tax=Porifericola rhodea TaxID=930972 RepID=UPI0026668D99|nr:malto-oligosyltrehalose synthase [Porifericola rhodea]WKN30758.1 malto-oligosyltrehalose synthase [Porifericola rhodea]
MHLARATYRVQLHKGFNFAQLKQIIPYLDQLGISTIYAAPFFKATPGSMHGYDVLDPLQINPEIGTLEEFRAISKELKQRGMQWLQDIVPNHMAFSPQNPWLADVMEKGPHSYYYRFFDINWLYPEDEYFGKVMVPTLGSSLGEVIKNQELKLVLEDNGLYLTYYEHQFPASMESYQLLFNSAAQVFDKQSPDDEARKNFIILQKKLDSFISALPDAEKVVEGWDTLKAEILDATQRHTAILNAVKQTADELSGDAHKLFRLLDQQYYRLCHWKTTEKKINFRRFFTVNDLICLNMQDEKVFDTYHQFIKQLLDEELIHGLRVDHVDGLLDPTTYLNRLRNLAGKDTLILVEKILEGDEHMPEYWPIQGSSGYDYLALSNQLLTHKEGGEQLRKQYQRLTHQKEYHQLVYDNKHFILAKRMAGELDNLIRLMQDLDIIPSEDTVDDIDKLKEALGHFLVAFPVYRVYGNTLPLQDVELQIIKETFEEAEQKVPQLAPYFQRLREIFNGVDDKDPATNKNKLYFLMRAQQFTGPLAAKGVEDTSFYQYYPLISHNEVGDSPEHLGYDAQDFHERIKRRSLHTMNTTSTHDTKRGEDARMRINVLSEIPQIWEQKVKEWQTLNAGFIDKSNAKQSPDLNDEYFFYQTLLGTYPFHTSPKDEDYEQRVKDYLLKAIREAKVNTNWADPNTEYEEAFSNFASQVLNSEAFLHSFKPFAEEIAQSAAIYSLSQIILKLSVPGIPDIYQGTEFWDLSMVDPDNRRPVDYPLREKMIRRLQEAWQKDATQTATQLLDNLLQPDIKLFGMHQTLQLRKAYEQLFADGDYQAVKVDKESDKHLLAFLRTSGDQQLMVIVPLNVHQLRTKHETLCGERCWQEAKLHLTEHAKGEWQHILINQTIHINQQTKVADVLAQFPVALLIKK